MIDCSFVIVARCCSDLYDDAITKYMMMLSITKYLQYHYQYQYPMREEQMSTLKWRLQPFDMLVQLYPDKPNPKLVFTFTNKDMDETYEAILLENELAPDLKHQFGDLETMFNYIKEKYSVRGMIGFGDDFSIQVKVERGEIGRKKWEKVFSIPALKLRQSQALINKKMLRQLQELNKKVVNLGQKANKNGGSPWSFFRLCVLLLLLLPFYYSYQSTNQLQTFPEKIASLQQKLAYFQQGIVNSTFKLNYPVSYTFSKDNKAKQMLISQNGKFCSKTTNNQHQYVVVQNSLGRRDAKITFNIGKMQSTISFGLTTLDYLQSIKFMATNGNKQTYSINTNRQIMQPNITERSNSAFSLSLNDVISVELIDKVVLFRKTGEPNAVALDVGFTEEQWKRSVLFVNLYAAGDYVGILN